MKNILDELHIELSQLKQIFNNHIDNDTRSRNKILLGQKEIEEIIKFILLKEKHLEEIKIN